jgi:hypothetical protein
MSEPKEDEIVPCDDKLDRDNDGGGWITIPKNRKYVTLAKMVGSIMSVPILVDSIASSSSSSSTVKRKREETPQHQRIIAEFVQPHGDEETKLDARVPNPRMFLDTQPLIAYAYYVHCPDQPPNRNFRTWEEYRKYVSGLEYLSPEWKAEHKKFASASSLGKKLGISDLETPEKHWSLCCTNEPEVVTYFREYILFRGLYLEDFVVQAYEIITGRHVTKSHSVIHPDLEYILSTSDGDIIDPVTGKIVGHIEAKCPAKRHAFFKVPSDYMTQCQFTMDTSKAQWDDFISFELNDYTYVGKMIIIRIYHCEEYVRAAIPVINAFCRAVLTGTKPPPRGTFDNTVEQQVVTEQIFHAENVVNIVPNGLNIVKNAIRMAKDKASEAVAMAGPIAPPPKIRNPVTEFAEAVCAAAEPTHELSKTDLLDEVLHSMTGGQDDDQHDETLL